MKKKEDFKPNFFRATWALTYRELKKWLEDPMMLLMFIIQPFIWMAFLGKSMNIQAIFLYANLTNLNIPDIVIPGYYLNLTIDKIIIPGKLIAEELQKIFSSIGNSLMQKVFGISDYFSFMAIGMISMITLTASTFSGVSIVWDRRLGFLDKVLVTPVSRFAIILSKILNASLRAMFQATIILILAYLLGLKLSPNFGIINILAMYFAIFLISVGFSSIFVAVSLKSTRIERPMQFINLITMPLMFSSNIFFPTHLMPAWLQVIASINPLTYFNDALRQLIIFNTNFSILMFDFLVLGIFASIFSIIGLILSLRFLSN